ncbi:MAG TPA: nucleoside 2-deoxyribosyltransferase, partial [Propionibacteriaceae bacterium]|nr:nucleoside 2-deoxyribosyltransferase [Propionibacteriaceae bacterium]
MWSLLDMLVEAGIDAWHGIQPSIGMTMPELQERYGGRICFWGGVDVDTLIAGTVQDVEEQVRIACESAPADGGLVLT